jgi:probable HAF family extracellular repeat protein
MWQSSSAVPVDLGTLGGTDGRANGINTKGAVVGVSALVGDSAEHATLWDHGAIVDLGSLGGSFSIATAINSKGEITGWSASPSGAPVFLWKNGVMTDISAGTQGNAFSINDKGQVVGVGSPGATLWSTTGK